jgi:CelD/BcsL family acetyltransferase involved in cellulose biosynthesis
MSLVGVLGWPEQQRAEHTATALFPLRAEVVRTREGLDALAQQWARLDDLAPATVFQSLGWARAIFDFEAQRGNTAFDPVIATVSDGSGLVGLLPLERIRTGTRTVLTPLGQAFGQYADALVAPGFEATPIVGRLLKAAISAAPCDVVSLLKVREDSALARGMPATRQVTGEVQAAPYVDLTAFPDFAAYFATIKPKTRKNMRNARNRLEREGPVEHYLASGQEVIGVVERTLVGRSQRLHRQGLTSRAFREPGFLDFCRSLAANPDLDLLAMSLSHRGEPVAEQWGFVHDGRYYAFVASRDFDHSDESPGKLHLGEVIRTAAERGLAGCDLGVPAMPYKLTWATGTVSVRDYALPVTPRGLFIVKLWDMGLRPRLKQLVLGMPSGVRSLAMKLVPHRH